MAGPLVVVTGRLLSWSPMVRSTETRPWLPKQTRVFAVYSDTPLDAAPLLEELRELGRRGGDAIRAQKALPGNAAQATIWFEKARQ